MANIQLWLERFEVEYFLIFSCSAKPPPPKKEIEIVSSSVLDGHIQYVDTASWAPSADTVFTASSDRRAILWDVRTPAAVEKIELEGKDLEYPVSCVGWGDDGELLGLGKDLYLEYLLYHNYNCRKNNVFFRP